MEIRKLESEQGRENREKKRAKIIGIVLLLLMVISTIGYSFLSNPDTGSSSSSGNGATQGEEGQVQSIGNKWVLTKDGQQFVFSSSPESVKNISVDAAKKAGDYYGSVIYIDSESAEITNEITSNLGRYASRVQEACYGPCNISDRPEKECSVNLIIYRNDLENRIYQNESCIFIEGDMRAADAFLYKIFGVS